MFDYQAGEKQKITLIMVGFAGLMAGMFFTMLLMPQPDPRHGPKGPPPKWKMDPDANGGRGGPRYAPKDGDPAAQAAAIAAYQGGQGGPPGQPPAAQQAPGELCNPNDAMQLVNPWLEYVWDLNAASAQQSQEKAIQYMTPDCAAAYRQNVWTADMAKQIVESGVQSSFKTNKVSVGQNQPDGSVVVFVDGDQVLRMAGKPDKTRHVTMEYLVKKLPEGVRIAGISEGSHS